MAGASGLGWRDAAVKASRELGLPLSAVGLDGDLGDEKGTWSQLYRIASGGAVLVRPDGHVAWRSRAGVTAPQAELLRVLRAVLGRATSPAIADREMERQSEDRSGRRESTTTESLRYDTHVAKFKPAPQNYRHLREACSSH